MIRKLINIIAFGLFFSSLSCNAETKSEQLNQESNSVVSEDIAQVDKRKVETIYDVNNSVSKTRTNAITEAVEKCSPAIVGINVTETKQVIYRDPFFDDPIFRHFFGNQERQRIREYEVQGLGSGFIISPDGYILTNHHVAGNATKVIITMTNGEEYEAKIIGSDMTTDVALLKIDGNNLPYLKFANSDNVIIGEWAIAFGNPFGLFAMNAKPTVTVGVVSNKDINFINPDQPQNRVYRGMIQTDAAISSGNSGGPLVNANGEVIGMNTIIYSTSQNRQGAGSIGIGFSIPINRVKEIVDLLIKDKFIDRNFITGMEIRELDDKLAKYLGINIKHGVVVFEMMRNGPALKAGFQLGDVILQIDDMRIVRDDDYFVAINDAFTGETLDFRILRDGREMNLKLKLEKIKI